MGEVPGSESPERPEIARGDDWQPGLRSELEHPQLMPTTNGTAIVALVVTLVPFPFVGGILGIVLGIFGLREIHRYGQTGGAIAVAAIIVGSVVLAIAILSPILLIDLGLRLFGFRP